jgi:hypothetical protein
MGLLLSEEAWTSTPEPHASLQADAGERLTTHPEGERMPAGLTTADVNVRLFIGAGDPKPVILASLEPLQEWEGVVEWVDGDRFGARLTDITEPGENEVTDFTLDEVSDDDVELVLPGGVFYWTIARETGRLGQRRHVSMLRFRRLPVVRAARRLDIRNKAERIVDELRLGADDARAASV